MLSTGGIVILEGVLMNAVLDFEKGFDKSKAEILKFLKHSFKGDANFVYQ
jgi:hypothetical protein